jgi:hypothetical protein
MSFSFPESWQSGEVCRLPAIEVVLSVTCLLLRYFDLEEKAMWGSLFERYLLSLCEEIPPQSLHFMTREEAYEQLKQLSHEDFGYDALKWEEWGREYGQFLPGWKGLSKKSR